MRIPENYLQQEVHSEMVAELLALDTAEDRLAFLMERPHRHLPIPLNERLDSRKVPGCLSGLWLLCATDQDLLHFSAFSESDLVHGVVSYVCDLYSGRTAREITEIGETLTRILKLDGLLSTTRKRALYSTLSFITHSAECATRQLTIHHPTRAVLNAI
jgi:sulfur transfer protein SufE